MILRVRNASGLVCASLALLPLAVMAACSSGSGGGGFTSDAGPAMTGTSKPSDAGTTPPKDSGSTMMTTPDSGQQQPQTGWYTVQGAQVLDAKGKPHLFRGVARPSLEFSSSGDVTVGDYPVIAAWGANVVRLPLNQGFWLNDPSNSIYDANYAPLVDAQVQAIEAAGMDVILDLHWSDQGNYSVGAACISSSGNCQQDMADAHSVLFWQQVAAKYKNDPHVIFELYNEPKIGGYAPSSANWDTWLNGGTSSGFTVHGMQELYTAIRNAGATNNLIVVGGLAWAADLSGVMTHAVQGTNILYAAHPYTPGNDSSPGTWGTAFGNLSATYPIIATEFGDRNSACTPTFDQNFIAYANKTGSNGTPANELSWVAWAFYSSPGLNQCTFPSLLQDYYDPNAEGMVVQAALMAGP